MSISFSGLASGLDTSSWVESLTALKRAKVETYQAEKEKLVLTQQTLASIKNFFNSFRSVVEKVTDSRFGIGGSLDLFAQNLAVSSKPNILTATANSEAQEGVYNIDVKNLATNTQASSNYSYITTQTVTATATMGSTLTSLGVKAGKIGVTVNDIERTVKIGNDETIQSFIEKLKNIGAQANYNEATGIFNVNISASAIRDIDNTGIVNALHLKGVNEGYTSNSTLELQVSQTVTEKATTSTKLSELGINSGTFDITSTTTNTKSSISIDKNSTIGDFINTLKGKGYNAAFTADGEITLSDAIISNDKTGLLKALGWDNPNVESSTQTSKALQYTTTLVEGTVADRNTLLKDIKAFNNGDTIIVKNSSNVTKTITLSQTSTIGNVLDEMNSAGLYANINSDGVVSISDGSIVGGTFDIAAAFNLTEQTTGSSVTSKPIYTNKTVAQDVTSTANITYTGIRDAQEDDKIDDFVGINYTNSENLIYICKKDGSSYNNHYTINENSTFAELFHYLSDFNIYATLENGVITLTNEGDYYFDNTKGLGKQLGIGVSSTSGSETVTIATTRTSGTLYYTATVKASSSDGILQFVECNTQIHAAVKPFGSSYGCTTLVSAATGTIVDSTGNEHNIFTGHCSKNGIITQDKIVDENYVDTFDNMFSKLSSYGITATMNNGVISLSSSNGAYVKGDLFEQLGIQTVASGDNTTKGLTMTSSSTIQYKYVTTTTSTSVGPEYTSIRHDGYMSDYFSMAAKATSSLSLFVDPASLIQCNVTIQWTNTSGTHSYTIIASADSDTVNPDPNIYTYPKCTIAQFTQELGKVSISDAFGYETKLECNIVDGELEISLLDNSIEINQFIISSDMFAGNITPVKDNNGGYGKVYRIHSDSTTGRSKTVTVTTTSTKTAAATGSIRFNQLVGYVNGADLSITICNSKTGEISTVSFSGTNILNDMYAPLNSYGMSAYQGSDGIMTIHNPSGEYYISGMSSSLQNLLHLQVGEGKSYSAGAGTTYSNTNSKTLTLVVDDTIDGSQRISDAHCGEIQINYLSKTEIIYASKYMTYNDVLDQLEGFGFNASITNGKITISSSDPKNVYITNFGGAFGMYGSGYTTSTKTTGTSSNTSSNRLQKEETLNANWDTKISQINSAYAGGSIVVQNSSNNSTTITFDKTDTLRDVRAKLAIYDIAMDLSGGKVTLSGTNNSYIQTIDSNMRSLFKLSNADTYKSTMAAITTEDRDKALSSLKTDTYQLTVFPASIYVYHNGNRNVIEIDSSDTIDSLASKLSPYGISLSINNGKLNLSSSGNIYLNAVNKNASDFLNILQINESNWKHNTSYKSSSPIGVSHSSSSTVAAARDTKLSDLGVNTGEYLLYKNGVKHTLYVSSDDTLGDFLSTIRSFGIESSLVTNGNTTTIRTSAVGDTYITASNTADKSNIIDKLFGSTNVIKKTNYSSKPEYDKVINNTVSADIDTRLADITSNFIKPGEQLRITVNGDTVSINIDPNETIGSLIDKFNSLGLNATYTDGKMNIQSGYNTLNIQSPTGKNYFTYSSDMGGYSATDPTRPITSTEVIVEENHNSVAKYANDSTKLGLLNISDGNLTIYRNGEKATIDVVADQTFADLRSKISAKFSDVYLRFENGHLVIGSNNADVIVGSTTDSSNFAAITGMHSDENKNSKSSRALYCVNNDSKVTTSGLFVRSNVTEGNFKVGNATITIDNTTTIDDIISQINYNDDSNATAYWDSIDGKFVIKSKTTGASLINIEAGTSNFTNVMGFTFTEDGKTKMNMTSQTLGENARFTINGTNFTSVSNTVGSDISRIQGVTLSLKDISNGETVTLKIEKDSETAATAVSDIVDAYNELIENIDKEVKRGAALDKESTLKLLKNQIRSLMTSSLSSAGAYKNLAQIGISLSAASSGNIRTDNINALSFDKDKFISSFKGDVSSLKKLLVGTEDTKGILTQVEDVLEQALGGVTGYFASAEKSYNTKISRLDDKIEKANKAADRYKMRLEAKFKSMDMLISKYQNNYSSFLGK